MKGRKTAEPKKGSSGTIGKNNRPRKSKKQDEGGTPEQRIEKAFDEIDKGNNLVKMKELRDKTGLSESDFNRAVFNLRKERKFTGNSSDGNYETLTKAERDAGIKEGEANLVYLSKKY